jgi:outer membrane protein assembly factor BamC
MKHCLRMVPVAALSVGLAACSTVQSWFPDKQKEYRYSSEIPALEIPPDLIGSTSGGVFVADEAPPAPAPAAKAGKTPPRQEAAAEVPPQASDSPIGKYRPAPPGAEASAAIAKDGSGAFIGVEAPFANVWTMAEKSLNRLFIEIKDKDRSQKTFLVYYAEGAKPFKPSWTDDLLAPFRGGKSHEDEREYQIRLESVGDVLTRIRVVDAAGQVQSQGEGYALLQAIHGKILALDQPEPKGRGPRLEDEELDDESR